MALLVLLLAPSLHGATLTFEQALARAYAMRGVVLPEDALRTLENAPRVELPTARVEGSWSNARNIDLFNEAAIHSQFFSLLVSVDYPLMDGGASAVRRRLARLTAQSFRERADDAAEKVFHETVDAVARLYAAQERRKILAVGLERALAMRGRTNELLNVREISNVTAAQWEDEAIAAEEELLALDLERLDAETRLRHLIGDTSSEPIEIVLSLDAPMVPGGEKRGGDFSAARAEGLVELARAARRPQVLLSTFGGMASVPSTGEDRYALYGVRMTIGLPMLDAAAQRREAEARLEAAETELARAAMDERRRRERDLASLQIAGLEKRIELLARAVDVAKARTESMARLTSAGLRSEAALAGAAADVARRESELLAARVELWRARCGPTRDTRGTGR